MMVILGPTENHNIKPLRSEHNKDFICILIITTTSIRPVHALLLLLLLLLLS